MWTEGLHADMLIGETSPLSFSIGAHSCTNSRTVTAGEGLGITGLVVEGLGHAARVSVSTVRSKLVRLTEGVYTARPLLLDPLRHTRLPLTVKQGTARRFWLDTTALVAGCHHGTVVVTFMDNATLIIPVVLDVASINLAHVPASLPVGFLGLAPQMPGTPFPESHDLYKKGFASAVRYLKTIGATGLSGGLGGPNLLSYDDAGNVVVDFAAADATMAALQDAWPLVTTATTSNSSLPNSTAAGAAAPGASPFLVSYGGMSLGGIPTSTSTWNLASLGNVHKRPWATVLADTLRAVADHAKTIEGWRRVNSVCNSLHVWPLHAAHQTDVCCAHAGGVMLLLGVLVAARTPRGFTTRFWSIFFIEHFCVAQGIASAA